MNKLSFFLLFCGLFLSSTAFAQLTPIGISIDDVKANKGEQLCLPVKVYNFQDMLSMQYTVQFDPEKLQFVGVVNHKLPYLTTNNFGLQSAQEGLITVVWIDNSLQGVTKNEGDDVFTLCFRVKAAPGEQLEVKFTDEPTPFESVNLAEQVVGINTKNGKIKVVK